MIEHILSVSSVFGIINLMIVALGGIYFFKRSWYPALLAALRQEEANKQALQASIANLKVQHNNLLLAIQHEQQLATQLYEKIKQWAAIAEQKAAATREQQLHIMRQQQARLAQQQAELNRQQQMRLIIPSAIEHVREHCSKEFSDSRHQRDYIKTLIITLGTRS
jgi:hypothetical protein